VDAAELTVAVHVFVGDNDREAKKIYLEHEIKMFQWIFVIALFLSIST
jgi:hypothetical protein